MPAAKSSSSGDKRGASGSGVKGASDEAAEASARGIASLAEDLANRLIKPFDLVLLTRDRIQATLDDAAERGRVTRSDANELVSELVRRGRQQTDDLLLGAERARRAVGSSFPIASYDELTVGQVSQRLTGLTAPQLRQVSAYERKHANRKSVLAKIDKLLA